MKYSYGFALPELLTVVAVASILVGGLVTISGRVFTISRFEFEQVRVTDDGRKEMERVSDALRNARSVDRNSDGVGTADNELWLQHADANSVTVFTNIDGDAESELVRYFVDQSGLVLQRGVTESNGGSYSGPESTQMLMRSLRNSEQGAAVFTYLPADSDIPYTGTLTLAQRKQVQRIGINFHVDVSTTQDPPAAKLYTLVTPRFGVCALSGCPGGVPGGQNPNPSPTAQPSVDLRVGYENNAPVGGGVSVPPGTAITLFWVTNNTSNCTASTLPADQSVLNWQGVKTPGTGSQAVSPPTQTTIFYLTCLNGYGSTTDYVQVTVLPAGVTLTANDAHNALTVAFNSPVTLAWNAPGTDNCVASGAPPSWSGGKATSGSQAMGNLTASITYTLRCHVSGNTWVEDAVAVTVTPPVDLKINGADSVSQVLYNTPLSFTWTSSGMASCNAQNGWTGAKGLSGSETVAARNVEYRLHCISTTGAEYADAVNVTLQPANVTLTAEPLVVPVGGSTTLTSTVSGAAWCLGSVAGQFFQWPEAQNVQGSSRTFSGINQESTFTLRCSNSVTEVSRSVTVRLAAPEITLTANPTSVQMNGSTTLNWSAPGAQSCTASSSPSLPSWSGAKSTSGGQGQTAQTATTTFTLTCSSGGGSASKSVTVPILPPGVDLRINNSNGPITVAAGSTLSILWNSASATSCAASGAWTGSLPVNGFRTRTAAAGTYTVSCTGPGGTGSDSVVVNVAP